MEVKLARRHVDSERTVLYWLRGTLDSEWLQELTEEQYRVA